MTAQHPDCWISFSGAQPYGAGWRYGEDDITPLDHYKVIRTVFRLDLGDKIPNHVGWYLKEEEQQQVDELEAAMDAVLEKIRGTVEVTQPEEPVPEETTAET